MSQKIVLTAIGSLGDVQPVIGLALGLERLGFEPVLAVSAAHIEHVHGAGLKSAAVIPALEEIAATQGMPPMEAIKGVLSGLHFLTQRVILPVLEDTVERLDEASDGAIAMAGTFLAFAAPIVAEKRNIPYIPLNLQPMSMLSVLDPPKAPDFRLFMPKPEHGLGRTWNRFYLKALHRDSIRRYAPAFNHIRARHGLPVLQRSPIYDFERAPALTLGLYSPLFAPPQEDHRTNTKVTGFPHDADQTSLPVDPGLEAFLAKEPAPLVFTLGTFVVQAPGVFYEHSIRAAKALGMRAVLMTGFDYGHPPDDDLFACIHAPHGSVFPHAAVIVHHGGIGTTGKALAAGRPQLIVPYMLDQWDNGERIRRLGVGEVLLRQDYTPERAAAMIARLSTDKTVLERAAEIGAAIREEKGAQTGAQAIADSL